MLDLFDATQRINKPHNMQFVGPPPKKTVYVCPYVPPETSQKVFDWHDF